MPFVSPPVIPPDAPPHLFPPVSTALRAPDGLLAVGGDLSPERLLAAYRRGIFPWYSDGPILWWSPDPRVVIFAERLHLSRRLRRRMAQQPFELSWDRAFAEVVRACAAPRKGEPGTWINADMLDAYVALHEAGHAHSVECWRDGRLAGGVYGVTLGSLFCGESMFSRAADASKFALQHVFSCGFRVIDCQLPNPHLMRLGAEQISRHEFLALIERCEQTGPVHG